VCKKKLSTAAARDRRIIFYCFFSRFRTFYRQKTCDEQNKNLPLENSGHLKFTLPPHGLPLTLITNVSAFPASYRMAPSQKQALFLLPNGEFSTFSTNFILFLFILGPLKN
jgi:hypothetical protein